MSNTLPPLPEHPALFHQRIPMFTADQMRAYAAAAVQAKRVAWTDKAMNLANDFGLESLRVGSAERHDSILNNGIATWRTIAIREKREAARERLRKHLYAAPTPAQAEPQDWEAIAADRAPTIALMQAENESLRAANERFGKRQQWWTDRMFAYETVMRQALEALEDERYVSRYSHIEDAITTLREALGDKG